MKLKIDFRLYEVSIELHTLERHLELIEGQIKQIRKESKDKFRGLPLGDEAERDLLRQDYAYQVELVVPRVLRNPFLVSLFAVYETTVTEIANLMQKKQGKRISVGDLRGDFLERAKKYYSEVLQFNLSMNNECWQGIGQLSHLGNGIAHANGRFEMMNKRTRKKIRTIQGISEKVSFVVVDAALLRKTFNLVKVDIEALTARYKQWDTDNIRWRLSHLYRTIKVLGQ